jgi:hypothetical protein
MGIRYLNKFILDNCSQNAVRKINLYEIRNKTIVIDASIYLYKFVGMNALCENLYLMISVLLHYKIYPIFIFDGKPPAEKKDLLTQRSTKKKEAEEKYNQLKEMKETLIEMKDMKDRKEEKVNEKIMEIEEKMTYLKQKFVRIKESDKETMIELLTAYGIKYIEAPGEADELCVNMVMTGRAWACMSDDMDMFVYGCKRVIRQISLMNHTCMFYHIDSILKDLDMSMDIFRQIMVISGTDYNIHDNTSLHETIKWYYEYQKYLCKNKGEMQPIHHIENHKNHEKTINVSDEFNANANVYFYEWMRCNTKYITDYNKLLNIYHMFILKTNHIQNIPLKNIGLKKNQKELEKILEKEGFIFLGGS